MKKLLKSLLLAVACVAGVFLAACNIKYSSSYSAMLMVSSNTQSNGSLSFEEFKGRYVFKFNSKSAEERTVYYTASLESGSVTVYYDCADEKIRLFEITAGGQENSSFTYTDSGNPLYIIIEAEERCGSGDFEFNLG